MKKNSLIRGGIIVATFTIIIVIVLVIQLLKGDGIGTIPQITNSNDIYMTGDGYDVTYGELYEKMIDNEGISYMINMIDETLLSSITVNNAEYNYIENVTAEELEEEIKLYKYGTIDDDLINDYSAATKLQLEKDFSDSLVKLGYDSEDESSINQFLTLSIAKRNYVYDVVKYEEDTSLYYAITDEFTESYYEENIFNDVTAITIRLNSKTEGNELLTSFNLVTYNTKLMKYTGSEDLSTLLVEDINDENTSELTDLEVLEYYILMYNQKYANREQLITTGYQEFLNELTNDELTALGLKLENGIAIKSNDDALEEIETIVCYIKHFESLDVDNDFFTYEYSTMYNIENSSEYETLRTQIFSTLNTVEEKINSNEEDELSTFLSRPYEYGQYAFFIYKLDQPTKTSYIELDNETIDEYNDLLINNKLTSSFINDIIYNLRKDAKIKINDYYLALQYKFNIEDSYKFNGKGNDSIVVSFGEETITADELFAEMESKVGVRYSTIIGSTKSLFNSDYYTERYGSSYKYLTSNNDTMQEHQEHLSLIKSAYANNRFADNGFSSDEYSWNEFLYLFYGLKDENAFVKEIVFNSLTKLYLKDSVEYSDYLATLNTVYDSYFSINATHMLICFDFDEDGQLDDYLEYRASLSGSDLTEFDTLINDFNDAIRLKLDSFDTSTLAINGASIVTEYQNASIDSDETWSEFKQAGLLLTFENLSEDSELDLETTANYAPEFQDKLKVLYDELALKINENETYLLDSSITRTTFGVHIIEIERGLSFSKPDTSVTTEQAVGFDQRSINSSYIPSESQIDLYVEYQIYQAIPTDFVFKDELDNTIDTSTNSVFPTTQYETTQYYFSNLYNAYYSLDYYTVLYIDSVSDDTDSSIEFTTSNDSKIIKMQIERNLYESITDIG